MLIDEIKSIKSEKRDLRNFGLTVGIVLGLLGGLFWWKEKDFYTYFLAVSLFLIVSGLLVPSILRPLQKGWMFIAVVLGWFMTRVILTVLFYFIVTPLSITSRIVGKDFLDKKFSQNLNRDVKSYWIPKKRYSTDKNTYEKQF